MEFGATFSIDWKGATARGALPRRPSAWSTDLLDDRAPTPAMAHDATSPAEWRRDSSTPLAPRARTPLPHVAARGRHKLLPHASVAENHPPPRRIRRSVLPAPHRLSLQQASRQLVALQHKQATSFPAASPCASPNETNCPRLPRPITGLWARCHEASVQRAVRYGYAGQSCVPFRHQVVSIPTPKGQGVVVASVSSPLQQRFSA